MLVYLRCYGTGAWSTLQGWGTLLFTATPQKVLRCYICVELLRHQITTFVFCCQWTDRETTLFKIYFCNNLNSFVRQNKSVVPTIGLTTKSSLWVCVSAGESSPPTSNSAPPPPPRLQRLSHCFHLAKPWWCHWPLKMIPLMLYSCMFPAHVDLCPAVQDARWTAQMGEWKGDTLIMWPLIGARRSRARRPRLS